jgi:hypothetical protein
VAPIVVLVDGDTDLDLQVYDENGNVIVSDTDYTNQCVLEGSSSLGAGATAIRRLTPLIDQASYGWNWPRNMRRWA